MTKPRKPKKPKKKSAARVVLWLSVAILALGLLGANAAVLGYFYISSDLPPLTSIRDYVPKMVTEVYDRNGKVFTRFFEERRTPRELKDMPPLLLKAIIAAEDADFYKHKGTDWLGLVRAAWKNVISGKVRQGASTITEQIVKTFLLSPERTVTRRIKAMLLAWRLERNFTKDEILALYLNQIYFGHGNYGVAEAARYYFGKDLPKLTLEECAVIAALPQGPELLTPYRHAERLKARQIYVLGEMLKNGLITREQHDAARKAPLKLVFHSGEETTRDYYADHIRQQLVTRFGQDAVLREGLRVEAAVDSQQQQYALESLAGGLRDVDKRQGYRGPLAHLGQAGAEALAKAAREKIGAAKAASAKRAAVLGCEDPLAGVRMGFRLKTMPEQGSAVAAYIEAIEAAPIKPEQPSAGVISKVSDDGVRVFTGTGESSVPFDTFKWARRFSPAKWTAAPKSPSDAFKPGDIVLLRAVEPKELKTAFKKGKKAKAQAATPASVQEFELDQEPLVQGAVVAMEPESREVTAMAGGTDFERSQFNRALQAKRQPGSAFKPVIYSLAIASKKYTPMTLVNDSPFIYKDPTSGAEWKPENFESESFDGLIPLKEALALSKNVISARLTEDLGVDAVLEQARKLGITSELPRYMSISLGAGEITPLELANAYATLAANGMKAEPVFLKTVKSHTGEILWKSELISEQAVDAAAAFVVSDMMRGVVEHGTAVRAKSLGRPAAGKTGTTNEGREAWFGGFVPHLLAVVYVGLDDHSPMGTREQGGRTAVPIWTAFMSKALKGRPLEQFNAPQGVVFVKLDPKTGFAAEPGSENFEFQAFMSGTEPNDCKGQKATGDLMREDSPAPIVKPRD
jgi:penicillin-binding protein 1A